MRKTIPERYSRQILFKEIGESGQYALLNSRVLLVGCGALGCAQAEMLARAGIGYLRIVDRDFVEHSNLQRQTLFTESDSDLRLPKAVAAKRRINAINSEINVEDIVADVNLSNVEELVKDCDLVIDGTDNFQVRYLVNDACVKNNVTWIYGAAVSSYGSTMTIIPGETPCLRCIFDEMPDAGSAPTCDTSGVIMPIIQTVAAAQAAEALKLLVGNKDAIHHSLMQFDIWSNERQRIKLGAPDSDCICCGQRKFEFLDADAAEFAAVLCGRDAVQLGAAAGTRLDLDALAKRLGPALNVIQNEYLLRFKIDSNDVTVFADGRAIIKGVDSIAAARSIYARYIGT